MINKIKNIMPNYIGRKINRKNSAILKSCYNEISSNIIGENGTIRSDILDLSKKIKKCSHSALVAEKTDIFSGEVNSRVMSLHRCGQHKLCPVCADAVSGDRIRKISNLLSENWESAKYCYMLTFTIKDGIDLKERLSVLKKGYRVWYLKGKRRGNKYSLGESSKIKGSTKSIEIGLGATSKVWHPHIHSIVFTDKPLDFRVYNSDIKKKADKLFSKKEASNFKKYMLDNGGYLYPYKNKSGVIALSKLSSEWREATRGEGLNIRCDLVFSPADRPKKFDTLFTQLTGKSKDEIEKNSKLRVIRSVKYSLKYSIKTGDLDYMSSKQIFNLIDVMRVGHRSIEFGGFLRGNNNNEYTCLTFDDYLENQIDIKNIKVPFCLDESKKRAELSKLLQFCRESDFIKFQVPSYQYDQKIKENLEELEKNKNQNSYSDLVKKEVLQKYTENPNNKIYQDLYNKIFINNEVKEIPDVLESSRVEKNFLDKFSYNVSSNIVGGADVALWQLGADLQRLFQSESIKVCSEYRQDRSFTFLMYKMGFISGIEYVEKINNLKEQMRSFLKSLRIERDKEINDRSDGLYYEILKAS